MEAIKRKPATYQDLEALAPNLVGEILAGDLYASPRPAGPHAEASSALGIRIGAPFRFGEGGPGGWWIVYEPEIAIDDDVVVPDLGGWRRERMPQANRAPQYTLVPDWVCEVVSPSTARLDRAFKMPLYAAWGVPHLWIVDPLSRTLEAFLLERGRWTLAGVWKDDALVRVAPFDAVVLQLGDLWGQ